MLTDERIKELFSFAEACVPREMCGLLFANHFHHTPNTASNPRHEFQIDHMDYLRACMCWGGKPWAIVHSHPTKGGAPSMKDCALMDALQVANQDLAMVIVGLAPKEIRCFKKCGDLYKLEWVHREMSQV